MAFNGSGTHVRVHDWTTDLANAVPVTASRMDAEQDDTSTALSLTVCRDGQSTTTARIPFAQGTSAAAGSTSSVAYAQTNDLNTGMYFPGSDQWGLVAGGTAVAVGTASGVAVTGTLSASGAATLSDALALTGNLAINTDKFTVTAASGNTLIAGTADVAGNLAVATNKFTVAAASGNTAIAGTLGVTGDVAVNTNKFTVAASSGNTAVAGTLGVSSDFAVATNKFTVAASSGNTAVAGTLAVTGAQTNTGALSANNSAGVTARNTTKAFGKVINGTLQSGSFNVASITDNGSTHTVTFTTPMANTDYVILLTGDRDNISNPNWVMTYSTVATGSFRVTTELPTVGQQDPDSYSFMVLSNE